MSSARMAAPQHLSIYKSPDQCDGQAGFTLYGRSLPSPFIKLLGHWHGAVGESMAGWVHLRSIFGEKGNE